ncbi:hypothetical protein [Arthrobacter bambusae]|uniref:Uncharacterized protein n=1 Tax=Arthrobacter bambusae TaxID=1338426 RepID=A0AAW8DDE7_9MICC|nr:hypothetical protein [Arthrobacter bambusae]MDP9904654.1 hypothetical protein [Arthrobacter bambusae]MDQ0129470.1 hypothetical protein [Arthrobacter bambusae]MDQ0180917.1 hypothetical protein [Arthrobacter bambusae]
MRRHIQIVAVAVAVLGILFATIATARPVNAQWLDREAASGIFKTKTIPAPLLAGMSPYCSWNSVITTTALVFTWAPPAGYTSSSVSITAQKGAVTQPVTGATTTSSGGVNTTTVPVSLLNALGSLLGGTIVIHLTVVDAPSGWVSKSVDYSWTMSLAGIAVGCSAKAPA